MLISPFALTLTPRGTLRRNGLAPTDAKAACSKRRSFLKTSTSSRFVAELLDAAV
jgi:hypothetical protein